MRPRVSLRHARTCARSSLFGKLAERLCMLSPVSPAVLCGQLSPLGERHLSGIAKTRAPDPWHMTRTGLVGDAQGDLKNHGGPEKAIHHYPFDHYAEWHKEFGSHPLLGEPGAFGENLSTTGWTEETVHIGDV